MQKIEPDRMVKVRIVSDTGKVSKIASKLKKTGHLRFSDFSKTRKIRWSDGGSEEAKKRSAVQFFGLQHTYITIGDVS